MFQGSEISCGTSYTVDPMWQEKMSSSGQSKDSTRIWWTAGYDPGVEAEQKQFCSFWPWLVFFFGQSLTKCMEVARTHHWRLKTWRIGLPAGFLCFGRRCRPVNRLHIDQMFTWWVIEAGEAGFLTHPVLWNHVAAWYSRSWTPTSSLAANIVKYEYTMDTCSEAISLPVFSTLVQRSRSHDSKIPDISFTRSKHSRHWQLRPATLASFTIDQSTTCLRPKGTTKKWLFLAIWIWQQYWIVLKGRKFPSIQKRVFIVISWCSGVQLCVAIKEESLFVVMLPFRNIGSKSCWSPY